MSKNKLTPARLFEDKKLNSGPVTCLGQEFENDESRREFFTEELRQKLQDPKFRAIEGFPIGEDEDILALSDPPYYTACPNPWIGDFITQWKQEKPEIDEHYHREPFAADVSEGRNDPIYIAHSYHTKVPHKAVMRYILYYTNPGDFVFDGFCGTGMTGVAAQMCGDRETIESLGYRVTNDGSILQQEKDEEGKRNWVKFSELGSRRALLTDLSPAATFIANNYNTPVDFASFEEESRRIFAEVEEECGWMYETKDKLGRIGKIIFTIWSDVFLCPECAGDVVFWDSAVNIDASKVSDKFPCPHCQAELTKRNMERAWTTKYDSALEDSIKQAKQVPVLINYTLAGKKGRFEKIPDENDLALIRKIENMDIPYWFPTNRMMEGKETRRNDPIGITHVHHFFTKRNLWILAAAWKRTTKLRTKFLLTSLMYKSTHLCAPLMSNYFAAKKGNSRGGWVGKERSGTLYCPSIHSEVSIFPQMTSRAKSTITNLKSYAIPSIQTCSSTKIILEDSSIDYIFLDPPFGANINYSELSFLWETWLNVETNNKEEAIENTIQGKGISEYRQLIHGCFKEAYRILKPGRWMTVEFSNTRASIWNSIQTAIAEAGFVVANVSALEKKQKSIMAYITPTAVKQDLVISAYKPNGGFEERFLAEASSEEGVWDFIRTHLKYLPTTKQQAGQLVVIPERDPRILFDQMVAYYVRKGYPVPLSSPDFQVGLRQRFAERDSMIFLPEQVTEYDRKKMSLKELVQASLFVSDEASAIQWLHQLLKTKPQTTSAINHRFMQEISGWKKQEKALELSTLLKQNFLSYDGKEKVPKQIRTYLSSNWKDMRNLPKDDPTLKDKAKDRWYVPDPNKAGDLEKLRERDLLKEFETYKAVKKFKRTDRFRLEAVRAGFKNAWQAKDYPTIITIAQKIPSKILEEDPKLLMWYDQAVTRNSDEI